MVDSKWPELLVIVRHGQSEHNAAIDLFDEGLEEKLKQMQKIRDADVALTQIGLWQAEQTGKLLAQGYNFDICYSSPYKRTVQTAEKITSQLPYDLRIFKDNRLREKEFGRLHGMSSDAIKDKYPDEYAGRKLEGKYWYRLLGGENYPDVETRVHSFLGTLARDWGGKKVLLVTHHVPYVMFRSRLEHLDEDGVLALNGVPNCGVQEYLLDRTTVPEGRLALDKYNAIAYNMADASKLSTP